MWDSNAVYFSLTKMKIMASREIYSLKPFRMAYSKTCRQHFGFFWLIWLVNQSNVLHVDISPCHMLHVIHFELSLSDEKICIIGLQNLSYFVLYSSVFWFIFAVSTGYLFGVCCNFNMCKRFYLTTCNRMSYVIGLRVRAAVQKAKSKKQKAWVSW